MNNDYFFGKCHPIRHCTYKGFEMTSLKVYETVSTKTIKLFDDFLHHNNVETAALQLTEVLELLYFLHSEGKTMTSELERMLADYLYDELITREMPDKQLLMVACYLSTLDQGSQNDRKTDFIF